MVSIRLDVCILIGAAKEIRTWQPIHCERASPFYLVTQLIPYRPSSVFSTVTPSYPPAKEIEAAYLKTLKVICPSNVAGAKHENQVLQSPYRPAYGTQGREAYLWTNSCRLNLEKPPSFYRYSIQVIPEGNGEEPQGAKRKQIIRIALVEFDYLKDHIGELMLNSCDVLYSFNGSIPQKWLKTKVVYRERGQDSLAAEQQERYSISFTK